MMSQFFNALYDWVVITKVAFTTWKEGENDCRQDKEPASETMDLFFERLDGDFF